MSLQAALASSDILASGHLLADESSIDVTELRDVDHWAETLGVSETELRMAVAEVGESARDVREHLGK